MFAHYKARGKKNSNMLKHSSEDSIPILVDKWHEISLNLIDHKDMVTHKNLSLSNYK